MECKPVDTPIEVNHGLCDALNDPVVDRGSYQRLVGRLIYLIHSRPDIFYVVSVVSRYIQNPREKQLKAVHKILQHLKGSLGNSILFKSEDAMTLEAYTDAEYVGLWMIEGSLQVIVHSQEEYSDMEK